MIRMRLIVFGTAVLAVLVGAVGAGAHEGATAHDTSGISTLEQTITGELLTASTRLPAVTRVVSFGP